MSHSKSSMWADSSIIIVTLIMLVASFHQVDSAERVNCRRVVFHPYCRGISAKRSSQQPTVSLPLQEAPELAQTTNNNNQMDLDIRKAWQGYLFSDLKQRIMDNYNRQQSMFQPMTAIVIDTNDNSKQQQEPQMMSDDQEFVLVNDDDNNGHDQFDDATFRMFNNNQLPPYMMNVPNEKRSNEEQQVNDELVNGAHHQRRIFHARMVQYPEFIRIFPHHPSMIF